MQGFPRTEIGGLSVSRMIIGTNWFTGYSHRSFAQDSFIRERIKTRQGVADILEVFFRNGVDTIMGILSDEPVIRDAIREAEDRAGVGCIRIDEPILNVGESPEDRAVCEAQLDRAKEYGAHILAPLHCCVEQLVDKRAGVIRDLDRITRMVRERGMVPALSAHMPEIITYSDAQGADVEAYVQIYNCLGFLMQIEVEQVHRVIQGAKKPVMTIKPMAAGRVTPFVGLNFVWSTIRDHDMVTVGTMSPREAEECIEISRAALERRAPDLARRGTPGKGTVLTD